MSHTIWYISKYISLPRTGTVGTRGFLLMREIARTGARVVMFTSDANHLTTTPAFPGGRFVERIDGVEICWLKTRKYLRAQSIGRVLSWLHFEWQLLRVDKSAFARPDAIVVSSLSLLTILSGLWLRLRFGCRLIFEVRDIWPLTLTEEGAFSRYNPLVLLLGLVERLGYRRADAIVGTMPNLAQHVREQTGRTKDVHTIPFGVERDMVEQVEPLDEAWARAHIPHGRFIVCHAGTIGTTNALETLFATAIAMRDEPVHFLIVGEGDLRQRFMHEYKHLSNLTFTGAVPKAMVQSVVARCDVAYFSAYRSRVWEYGMSLNKVVDYMLAATPVIGSFTGYRTMIEDARCGSIVPAGDPDALRREIEKYARMTQAERGAIGARGRNWLLEHRDYARLAASYLDILLPAARRGEVSAGDSRTNRPSEAAI